MAKAPTRLGVVFTAVFRIFMLTLAFTALGMAIGLFCGIIGTVIYGAAKHVQVNMANAYRDVAIPTAIAFGAVSLLYNILATIRRAVRHA